MGEEYLVIKCKGNKKARLACNTRSRVAKCPSACNCFYRGKVFAYSLSDICPPGTLPEVDGGAEKTSASAPQKPAAPAPATQKPAAPAPATQRPAAPAPATQRPAAPAPVTQKPAAGAVSPSATAQSRYGVVPARQDDRYADMKAALRGASQPAPAAGQSPASSPSVSAAGQNNAGAAGVSAAAQSRYGVVSARQDDGYTDMEAALRGTSQPAPAAGQSPAATPSAPAAPDPAPVPAQTGAFAGKKKWLVTGRMFVNPRDALKFIFEHWITYEVFENRTLKKYFLDMANACKPGCLAAVREIGEREEDENFKFFRIFHRCIFPERQDFCFSVSPVTGYGQRVIPIFSSREDMWKKLYKGERSAEFFVKMKPVLAEYLGLEREDDLFAQATQEICRLYGALYVFADRGAGKAGLSFGDIGKFAESLSEPLSAIGTEREEALRTVSLRPATVSYTVDCSRPAFTAADWEREAPVPDDDTLRHFFPRDYSSVYATLWKRHVLFVHYSVNVLKRGQMRAGDLLLTRRGLYGELRELVRTATTLKNLPEGKSAFEKLNYVRALLRFDRNRTGAQYGGALDFYVQESEREGMGEIVAALKDEKISLESLYEMFVGSGDVILRSGGRGSQTIEEYISSLAADRSMGAMIRKDADLKKFLAKLKGDCGAAVTKMMGEIAKYEEECKKLYGC